MSFFRDLYDEIHDRGKQSNFQGFSRFFFYPFGGIAFLSEVRYTEKKNERITDRADTC